MIETRHWKVGELARAVGVSVRTLHHYESLGLLKPVNRTDSGHRLYVANDVRRLYRVMALRSLGLGLAEITRFLDSDEAALVEPAQRHLSDVDRTIEAQIHLRSRLDFILRALEREEEPSVHQFLEAMEAMTMFERYFSNEQLAELKDRHAQLGDDAVKRGEQQWKELLSEAEAARKAGIDPASPELQHLWQSMQKLIEQFTGGNPAIRDSLQRMYETEDISQASRGAVSQELWAYMRRAGAANGSS